MSRDELIKQIADLTAQRDENYRLYREALSMGELTHRLLRATIRKREELRNQTGVLYAQLLPFKVYECREIGEGDWVKCNYQTYRDCKFSALHDTRESLVDVKALAAQVDAMKKGIHHFNRTRGDLNPLFEAAFKSTPATCLAQVKADAGRAGFIEAAQIYSDWISESDYLPAADQYADRIRQEAAK